MKNPLAVIEKSDLAALDQKKVKRLAREAARHILQKINAASERIEEAKSDAESAQQMKAGWFGKTRKKADATADALVRTNEAIADMHALIQESIRYTQLNADLSKAMHLAMSQMVASGFKDRDGELTTLNKSGEEFAAILLEEAETFSEKQLEIETLQARQAEQLRSVEEGSQRRADQLGQDIERLKAESREHIADLKDIVARRTAAILTRSDANDKLHQKLIDDLQKSTEELRKASDSQDEIHTAQIQKLQRDVQEYQRKIQELEKAQNRFASKYLPYIATVASMAAIATSTYAMIYPLS